MFGYPTDIFQEGAEFTMISYHIPNEEDKIVLWVILKGEEDPKAIKIPYNPNDQENLGNIAQKMSTGQKFLGQFKMDGEAGGEEGEGDNAESGGGTLKSSDGMLNFTELTVEHFLPLKDYLANEEPKVSK